MATLTRTTHHRFSVAQPEDTGAARRAVARLAADAGVHAGLLPALELVVTELGSNLVRHTPSGGSIIAGIVHTASGCGVEVVSVDRGPGIRDVDAALRGRDSAALAQKGEWTWQPHDGLGCGLAAVRRLASTVDVWSLPGVGTAVLARLLPGDAQFLPRWAGIATALDNDDECGDAWAVVDDGARTTVIVVDGLGHGPAAAEASRAAVTAFESAADVDLESLARRVHEAMRGTRGGAVALCRLDAQRGHAEYVGVGNISGRLVTPGSSQAMVSMSGTLGAELTPPRIRRLSYDVPDGATLVMHSDGVRDGFDVEAHAGLLQHDPLLIAAVIHGERVRGSDDATVVVLR